MLPPLLTIAASIALAGPTQPGPGGSPPLRRVEAGFADVGPLGAPMREFTHDLRTPTGFADVYAVSPSTGLDGFARASGAITAIFPRSVYVPTKKGTLVAVPPGTIFYIGALPKAPVPRASRTPAPGSVDARAPSTLVDRRSGSEPLGRETPHTPTPAGTRAEQARREAPEASHPRSIFEDELYRRRHIAALLANAAAHEPD